MMGPRIVLFVIAIALIAPVPGMALRFIARTKASSSSLSYVNYKRVSTMTLFDKISKGPEEKSPRKIAKYDNLGDPIYEDELQSQGGSGINVLGVQIDADPLTVSLLVFAVIAVQFFGVLFFQ